MNKLIRAFLPPALAGLLIASIFALPQRYEMSTPSISGDFPLEYELAGWHGVKRQESEAERKILAADTRFSKAQYTLLKRVPWESDSPPVEISIVFSGRELNNSIHRPEVCLPSQGHLNLQGQESELELANGESIQLTRLSSHRPLQNQKISQLRYIHYYLFVGDGVMTHTHLNRNLRDILDRCLQGKVQSWAYFQAGTWWSPELGISEEDADRRLRKLIAELLPRQIDWKKMK